MSKQPLNDTWNKQHKKLVRATFKKAFISNVNVSANTADVYFAENPSTTIRNIPLASNVNTVYVSQGDKCRVDVFDETNPNDMVIAYIYGKVTPIQKIVKFNTGTFTKSNGTGSTGTIAHGLGVIPDVYGFTDSNNSGATVLPGMYITSVDSTNINIAVSATTTSFAVDWFVIKFT